MQQASGILVEHNTNDLLLYSPNQIQFKSNRTHSSSARTSKTLNNENSEATLNQCIPSKSLCRNPCASEDSPSIRIKEDEIPSVPVTCVQSQCSSVPGESSGDHTGNNAGFETFSM